MNSYFALTEEQQRLLLSQTAARVGLPEQAVEKDLWVTTVLQEVFTLRAKVIAFLGRFTASVVQMLYKMFNRKCADYECIGQCHRLLRDSGELVEAKWDHFWPPENHFQTG